MATAGSLGEVVRDRRRALGLTQEQLAERIGGGLRQAEISRIERGRVALPRRGRLDRIAAALELSVGELLVRSGWNREQASMPVPPVGAGPTVYVVDGTRTDDAALGELRSALVRAQRLQARTDELLHQAMRTAEHAGAAQVGAERAIPGRRGQV